MIKAKVHNSEFVITDDAKLIGGNETIKKIFEVATIRPLHPWEGDVSMVVLGRMKKMLPNDLEVLEEAYPVPEPGVVY